VYGFRSEGLRVKTLPCCSKCTTLCAVTKVRHHWMYGFRKCGSRDKIAKAKPPTPLATERVSKDTGVGAPQDAENLSCGPFIPFGKAWEHQRAWHRPGENEHGWMFSLSYSSSITMRAESEPRSISQHIAYRGVAEEAVGTHAPWRSVTYLHHIPFIAPLQTTMLYYL
jgi:hypothetical protein